MRKLVIGIGAVALGAMGVAPLSASAATAHRDATVLAGPRVAHPTLPDVPRYFTPNVGPNFSVVGPTVKYFAANQVVGSTTYHLKMVGTFPTDKAHPKSTVTVKVIPVAFHFSDGVTLDPTKPLPSCAGGGTALNRTLNSGIFKNIPTNVGGARQFTEAFRRAEFWYAAKPGAANPNYSGRLAAVTLPKITVNVSGPSVAAPCGRGGNITINSMDNLIKTNLIPHEGGNVKTSDMALFVWSNIVLCTSSCGILGYHSAFQRSGHTQTYGVAEFATDKRFHNVTDTTVLSHEVAEWYDDPFVDNATPRWGHIGQVSGCQANLEVGDPLSGTLRTIKTTGGVTSHVQDLAYYSWFYRQKPSLGFGGTYSLYSTFKVPSKPC